MLNAALNGELESVEFETDPRFGFAIPKPVLESLARYLIQDRLGMTKKSMTKLQIAWQTCSMKISRDMRTVFLTM